MTKQLLRIYKKIDVNEIRDNLLIFGDLSGSCAKCKKMDLKLEMRQCPECKTDFNYIAFRNVRSHLPKINKLYEQAPSLTIIDYGDYEKNLGSSKAHDIFK